MSGVAEFVQNGPGDIVYANGLAAGLTLVTYSAEPGSPSEAALRELAGWSAARDKLNAVEATSEA